MKPQLLAVPVALALMLVAVALGALRLLTLQGISPTPVAFLQEHHGEMIIFGFLTPLILTERYLGATTFSLNRSIHLMPFLAMVGAVLKVLAWLSGVPLLNLLGSVVTGIAIIQYIYLLYSVGRQSAQPLPFHYMILGAVILLLATMINIYRSPVVNPAFTLLLISFPIFTILGERVELSRFLSPKVHRRARWGLWLAILATVSLLVRLFLVDAGYLIAIWAGLLGIATLPLVVPELTLVRLGQTGLHRYLGRHLILAYAWFFIGLVIIITVRESYPLYDAGSHALAIGFVFTMIMAHAPVIAPVIVRGNIVEEKLAYYPVAILTASVIMRVAGQLLKAGNIDIPALAGLSGVIALVAIIVFFPMMFRSLRPA